MWICGGGFFWDWKKMWFIEVDFVWFVFVGWISFEIIIFNLLFEIFWLLIFGCSVFVLFFLSIILYSFFCFFFGILNFLLGFGGCGVCVYRYKLYGVGEGNFGVLLIKIGFCLFVVLVILKSLLRGLLYENDLFLDIIVVFLDLFMLFFWVCLFIYWIFLFLEILLFGFFILIDVLLCWILRLLVMNCFFWVWDLFLNRFVVFVMFIVVEKLSFFFFFFLNVVF